MDTYQYANTYAYPHAIADRYSHSYKHDHIYVNTHGNGDRDAHTHGNCHSADPGSSSGVIADRAEVVVVVSRRQQ